MSGPRLSSAELDYMRAEAIRGLPDTCLIQTAQQLSDDQGGFTEEWAISYVDIRCRLSLRSGRERAIAGRETAEGEWIC